VFFIGQLILKYLRTSVEVKITISFSMQVRMIKYRIKLLIFQKMTPGLQDLNIGTEGGSRKKKSFDPDLSGFNDHLLVTR
jgi:hypothetical protein